MTETSDIHSRLGGVEANVRNLDARVDRIDEKLEVLPKLAVSVEHMDKNLSMMKGPVNDYEKVKQRALGMWILAGIIFSALSIGSTFASYLIRAYLLKIGTP